MHQNPVLSRVPDPTSVTYPFVAACCYIHANAWRRYALQKNLVAKVLVASHEILLQTHVAEWPPEPVTNPVFDSQPYVDIYPICVYVCIYTHIPYKRTHKYTWLLYTCIMHMLKYIRMCVYVQVLDISISSTLNSEP